MKMERSVLTSVVTDMALTCRQLICMSLGMSGQSGFINDCGDYWAMAVLTILTKDAYIASALQQPGFVRYTHLVTLKRRKQTFWMQKGFTEHT